MRLSFHGADRNVTGSCHLVECAGKRVLVDCGLYQGSRELAEDNAEPFGFEPAEIDVVILTHAHLDHCGRLPLLVKRGFTGEIVATRATRELARLVLLDSARLNEEDAERRARRRSRGKGGDGAEPLYSVVDAMETLDSFGRAVALLRDHRCRARHPRDVLRRRTHPRLGQRAVGTDRRGQDETRRLLRRHRQRRASAARPADASAAVRCRGHGDRLTATATTVRSTSRSRNSTRRSRTPSTAAATSSSRPSRWSARRSSSTTCTWRW